MAVIPPARRDSARVRPLVGPTVIALLIALLLACSRAPAGAAPPGSGTYGWPLNPRPAVVAAFDPPAQRWQTGHRGVDLAVAPGSPVLSAGPGTVRFAGVVAGRPTVSIAHPDGTITTYEPVTASVRTRTVVARGDQIGVVQAGHPGCRATACLHWGARRGSGHQAVYLDPLSLLGAVHMRLKPLQPHDAQLAS